MTSFGRRPSSAAERYCAGALALVLSLGLSASCTRSDTTPVARGEYYAAGQPDYDEFFVRLYRHQVGTAAAVEKEAAARAKLSSFAGAEAGADGVELEPHLARRASELRQRGLRVELVLGKAPPAPPAELKVAGKPEDEKRENTALLRDAATELAELQRQASETVAELDDMRLRALELERDADRAFWKEGAGKRAEVKQNLRDARKLLVLMSDRQKAIAESTRADLQRLARAFPEAPPRAQAERAPSAKVKKKPRARKGAGRAAPRKKRSTPAQPKKKPAAPERKAPPKPEFEP